MKILYPPMIGKQERSGDAEYRMMRYVVEQEVDEGLLLYNTLTCAMALVSREEAQHPTEVEGLVENWFLVAKDYDEKRLCKMLRIGARLKHPQPRGIRRYTILTTTGCNARCAYCFEQGATPVNMTEETAEKVVQYIARSRGEHEEVTIKWFGGEPLYNYRAIDKICTRLREEHVPYSCTMLTNGYLMGGRMVEKAAGLWNMKKVQVTIDGTEENYNRIKNYVGAGSRSPYRRVLDNVARLLEQTDMRVVVRIHLEHDVLDDIWALTRELAERFRGQKRLRIYFIPLFENYGPTSLIRTPRQRAVIYKQKQQMVDYLEEMGFVTADGKKLTGGMKLNQCGADSGQSVVITPDGNIGLCDSYVDSHFVGRIDSDERDSQQARLWTEYMKEMDECDSCVLYPRCYRLKMCPNREQCFKECREDSIETVRRQMRSAYRNMTAGGGKADA